MTIRSIAPRRIELLDDSIVEVLRQKSPVERLAMAFAAERTMHAMLTTHLRSEHPDWGQERIAMEVARRRLLASNIVLPDQTLDRKR